MATAQALPHPGHRLNPVLPGHSLNPATPSHSQSAATSGNSLKPGSPGLGVTWVCEQQRPGQCSSLPAGDEQTAVHVTQQLVSQTVGLLGCCFNTGPPACVKLQRAAYAGYIATKAYDLSVGCGVDGSPYKLLGLC